MLPFGSRVGREEKTADSGWQTPLRTITDADPGEGSWQLPLQLSHENTDDLLYTMKIYLLLLPSGKG